MFQFLLWISYTIVFLLTELFLRDQGLGESWRSWLNPSHYKLMHCYTCEVGPCWFWQELLADPKKLMTTKPVSFTFVPFYVIISIGWTTVFLLNLDSLKIAPVASSVCVCYHTAPLVRVKGENSVIPCYSLCKYTTAKKQQESQIHRWLHNSYLCYAWSAAYRKQQKLSH